jgi:hypothetical protein
LGQAGKGIVTKTGIIVWEAEVGVTKTGNGRLTENEMRPQSLDKNKGLQA